MDYRIRILVAHLESNLHQPLVLEELASLVNLSVSRLQHLFKDETGMTIGQYLRHLRLDAASMLMKTTCLTVKEVRGKVGYFNTSCFIRDFKQTFGMTPLRYRKENFMRNEIAVIFE
jgi:AraC family transcriptional regulator of arabinose operon